MGDGPASIAPIGIEAVGPVDIGDAGLNGGHVWGVSRGIGICWSFGNASILPVIASQRQALRCKLWKDISELEEGRCKAAGSDCRGPVNLASLGPWQLLRKM